MSAPLQATPTEDMSAATSGLYRVEINTGTTLAPTWTEVMGIQKWSPKYEQVTEDDTDISSGAFKSEFPVGNGFTVDVDGLTKGEEDPSFVADPGVQAMLDASEAVGRDGIVHMRYWRTDDLPEAKEFYATCKVSRAGEKPPALDKWSGTLTGRGKPKDIVKPTATVKKKVTIMVGTTAYTASVAVSGGSPQTTSSISTFTANALKTALEALANVGAGHVVVTGSGSGPFTAEFDVPVTSMTAAGTGGVVQVDAA